MASVPAAVLVLVLAATFWAPEISAESNCWSYHDHAAQYHLDHQAPKYPWDEVESMMKQNPSLSEVLAKGTKVPTSRPPGQHYYTAVSVVCPSERFMLKAFTVDNKHCYVIKPQVQQLRYTRCSEKHNRDCHYCNYKKGGISKCEEDYEWQTVWAYCKKIPSPHPYHQPHHNNPYPFHKPTLGGYPVAEPEPYRKRKAYYPAKLYAKRTYTPYRQWKRSVRGWASGKLEKISLYLPYQCSCKSFRC